MLLEGNLGFVNVIDAGGPLTSGGTPAGNALTVPIAKLGRWALLYLYGFGSVHFIARVKWIGLPAVGDPVVVSNELVSLAPQETGVGGVVVGVPYGDLIGYPNFRVTVEYFEGDVDNSPRVDVFLVKQLEHDWDLNAANGAEDYPIVCSFNLDAAPAAILLEPTHLTSAALVASVDLNEIVEVDTGRATGWEAFLGTETDPRVSGSDAALKAGGLLFPLAYADVGASKEIKVVSHNPHGPSNETATVAVVNYIDSNNVVAPAQVEVTVTDGGDPVEGATVDVSTWNGSSNNPTVLTGADGKATVWLKAATAATITATKSAKSGTASKTQAAGTKGTATIAIS